MRTGFAPSYELDSPMGREVASLKGLDKGWHYPTFLLAYVRNPGPLLLFDEIIIDDGASRKAIEHLGKPRKKHEGYEGRVAKAVSPKDAEIRVFTQLIQSKLFRKQRIVNLIDREDLRQIERGYRADYYARNQKASGFHEAVSIMKSKYGADYALPTPEKFEAMNINLTSVILRKLKASPLDDVMRIPLYEYKATQTLVQPPTKNLKAAYDLIDKARIVLYLPTTPIEDIDAFLALHKDPTIQDFRRKVWELSNKDASPQDIAHEIFQANQELQQLNISKAALVASFIGIIGGAVSLCLGSFGSGSIIDMTLPSLGILGGMTTISDSVRKIQRGRRYDWLRPIRGLCQT